MTSKDLIERYLKFFKEKGHTVIPSAPLIPENDPSVLFTTAGMHPLVPFLLGEKHPGGKRLVDNQVCLRTNDIDEVGDTSHQTFFEMLGNWSLGDYWKKESITWSYEFLIKELGIKKEKLWITCFEGDKDAHRDTESSEIWEGLGIPKDKIIFLPKEDNWWGPAGETGPCGPDTEIFYDVSEKPCGKICKPGDGCGRFFEIWNNVFMQYNKKKDGSFELLKQKNVDTGMGVDRTTAVLNGLDDNYLVKDLWREIINSIEEISQKKYTENLKAFRIIADHVRASTFVIGEGVIPSNKLQGYVLRRLIRRAIRFGKILGIHKPFLSEICESVISTYKGRYPILIKKKKEILSILIKEENKFTLSLKKGLKEIENIEKLNGKNAFYLYETYGFPLELTEEIAEEKGQKIDKKVFEEEFEKHKNLSRSASAGMFKGGLSDASEEVTKLHTATHLLHKALRIVLGEPVQQKGSNITSERLRFDFSYNQKLSDKEIKKVEVLINEQIEENLPVTFETKSLIEAKNEGALAFFGEKYGGKVKVYTVGDPKGNWYSKEVCGGPHVSSTKNIGRVKIIKQEKIGAEIVRIYATNK
ncbi:MAG: alanine--tRNA ligase [Patescibacteria group bacterium]|nr:alanine--tRNA ligase [Patescibacteria group bacterium]